MKRSSNLLFLSFLGALGGSILSSTNAAEFDFKKETVPQRWIEELVPEDLPALKYPEYFTELDQAKAQAAGGRYRLALVTLSQIRDADPVEAALVKASALSAVGRSKQALDALADEKVANEPRARVMRAQILARQGKTDEAMALLKKLVGEKPDSIAARYELGRLYEQVGDIDSATKAYAWFVQDAQLLEKWRGQTGEAVFDDANSVTLIARAIDRWANLTGAEPRVPLDAVRMARTKMFVSHEKAKRELGFEPSGVDGALARAVEWFGSRCCS